MKKNGLFCNPTYNIRYLILKKYFYIICCLLVLLSCKTTSKFSVKFEVPNLKADGPVLKNVYEANLNYDWLRYKASTSIENDGEERSFKTNVKIRKDSLMWMSITKGPIQAFKILMDADSIRMINEIDENYILGSFDEVSDKFGVDMNYQFVENMLIGNSVDYKELKKMKVSIEDDMYVLSNLNRNKLNKHQKNKSLKNDSIWLRYWVNPGSYKIEKARFDILTDDSLTSGMEVKYDNFVIVNTDSSSLMPSKITFSIDKEGDVNFMIIFELSRIKSGEPFRLPFEIPKGYQLNNPLIINESTDE